MANNRFKNLLKKTGMPPGSLVHIGNENDEPVNITLIKYNETLLEEIIVEKPEDISSHINSDCCCWINIDGVHNIDIIQSLGDIFKMHPLTLEDILNTTQRPKLEEFDNQYLYVVLKMLSVNATQKHFNSEQISLILGENFVISFQEIKGDVFEFVRQRIRTAKGRIRKEKASYLFYSLIDAIVDNYFYVLEDIASKIEQIEDKLVGTPSSEILREIHSLKSDLIFLRRVTWPLREIINGIEKTETSLIDSSTKIYLRDIYDHVIQINDSIEAFRDSASTLLDIYLSTVSNQMNKVMQVLTMIATIFIPLTFIAGIYGMNFKYMPELEYKSSYPIVIGVMFSIAIGMVIFFKRKKWF